MTAFLRFRSGMHPKPSVPLEERDRRIWIRLRQSMLPCRSGLHPLPCRRGMKSQCPFRRTSSGQAGGAWSRPRGDVSATNTLADYHVLRIAERDAAGPRPRHSRSSRGHNFWKSLQSASRPVCSFRPVQPRGLSFPGAFPVKSSGPRCPPHCRHQAGRRLLPEASARQCLD